MSSSEQPADTPPEAVPPAADAPTAEHSRHRRQALAIIAFLIFWTYAYNVGMKGEGFIAAFFGVLDTISDDFVMGSLLTIGIGAGIVIFFSLSKLYSQIMANVAAFRILEEMVFTDLKEWRFKEFFLKLVNFRDLPRPNGNCPLRIRSILISFCFIYFMSWIYVILFSEALFFASWSAGVDLPITKDNVLFMPTLALAIPFSARVMAYVRYPYAQDFADLMPAATFVLLLVTMLGYIFESDTQHFYLERVFSNPELAHAVLINGVYLGFIPVFSEAIYWLIEVFGVEANAESAQSQK